MKTVDTLQKDIEHVLKTGEGWTQYVSQWVSNDIEDSLNRQFNRSDDYKTKLRMSNLGTKCDRKLYYSINTNLKPVPLSPNAKNKFLFGDMVESLVLGLVLASGHRLEGLQTHVSLDGVNGRRDCVIDGMTFDVKSASSNSFKKFKANGLLKDGADEFGYLEQLSAYVEAGKDDPLVKDKSRGGFLAVDKQFGHISVDIYNFSEFDIRSVVKSKKEVLSGDLPERPKWSRRVYDRTLKDYVVTEVDYDWTDGKSGNRCLSTYCSYCDFKRHCWPNLREFVTSSGPKFLTTVTREPKGLEVT